jgi:lipid-binding SYLF domain-containing protein
MRTHRHLLLVAATSLFLAQLPAQAGWNPLAREKAGDQPAENLKTAEAIASFKNSDPSMQVFFDKARGYAIFPTVGKGGMGIGGAYGKGEVYEKGKLIGYSSLTQLTLGFQLGGQAYSEIIFFKDKAALERFTSGNFEFSAQASAVAATAGASADAAYNNGVAIFTLAKGGLMYEASVGGQKFSYTPR